MTTSASVAQNFANNQTIFTSSSGIVGVDISRFSAFPGEGEVLLLPSIMKIFSVDTIDSLLGALVFHVKSAVRHHITVKQAADIETFHCLRHNSKTCELTEKWHS